MEGMEGIIYLDSNWGIIKVSIWGRDPIQGISWWFALSSKHGVLLGPNKLITWKRQVQRLHWQSELHTNQNGMLSHFPSILQIENTCYSDSKKHYLLPYTLIYKRHFSASFNAMNIMPVDNGLIINVLFNDDPFYPCNFISNNAYFQMANCWKKQVMSMNLPWPYLLRPSLLIQQFSFSYKHTRLKKSLKKVFKVKTMK